MKILLLAEDNEFVQRMFSRVFTASDFTVITANDGTQALDSAISHQPDVIVLDVMMPNMNGIEALKALKADDRTLNIPVIMLSAHDDENLMMEAMNAGAARYLVKSTLDPDAIVAIVKQVIG